MWYTDLYIVCSHLEWNEDQHSLCVKSVLWPLRRADSSSSSELVANAHHSSTSAEAGAGTDAGADVLCLLAYLRVMPLEFVALLEIRKSVRSLLTAHFLLSLFRAVLITLESPSRVDAPGSDTFTLTVTDILYLLFWLYDRCSERI